MKSNLCQRAATIRLRIVQVDGQQPTLDWEGECDVDFDANLQALAMRMLAKPSTKLGEAKAVLTEVLSRGPMDAVAVVAEVKRRGVSDATRRRAYDELGIVSRKAGKGWLWSVPTPPPQDDHGDTLSV